MTKAVPASPTLAYLIPGGAFASGQGYYVDRSPRGLLRQLVHRGALCRTGVSWLQPPHPTREPLSEIFCVVSFELETEAARTRVVGLGAVARSTTPPEEAERVGRDRRGAGGVTSRDGERTSGSALAWLGAAGAIWGALTGPLRRFCSGAASPPRCCTFGSVPVRGSADLTGSAFAMLTRGGCG